MNVYAVTVQCYGPSTITIFVGYCMSDMFLTGTRRWKRRQTRSELVTATD